MIEASAPTAKNASLLTPGLTLQMPVVEGEVADFGQILANQGEASLDLGLATGELKAPQELLTTRQTSGKILPARLPGLAARIADAVAAATPNPPDQAPERSAEEQPAATVDIGALMPILQVPLPAPVVAAVPAERPAVDTEKSVAEKPAPTEAPALAVAKPLPAAGTPGTNPPAQQVAASPVIAANTVLPAQLPIAVASDGSPQVASGPVPAAPIRRPATARTANAAATIPQVPGGTELSLQQIEKAPALPIKTDAGSLAPPALAADLGQAMAEVPQNAGQGASAAAAPVSQRSDFTALVDRLIQAREVADPVSVHAAIAHAEFGQVSLRFEQGDQGLSVTMASSDPGFAPAVQAAITGPEAAGSASDGAGRDSAPRQDGNASAGGRSEFSQARGGQSDQRREGAPAEHRAPRAGRSRADHEQDQSPRGGIFA